MKDLLLKNKMEKLLTRDQANTITRVVYHSPCGDGFGGAYCFWKLLNQDYEERGSSVRYNSISNIIERAKSNNRVKYIGVSHNTSDEKIREKIIPQLEGENVVFVDFCYSNDIMREIVGKVRRILILDHHKTTLTTIDDDLKLLSHLDMDKSGAILAWNFCFPDQTPPQFLKYIEDRDIWKWEFPETDPFTTVFYNEIPYEFEEYARFEEQSLVDEFVEKGKIILQYENNQIEDAANHAVLTDFLGYKVAISNSTVHASKLGNVLAKKEFEVSNSGDSEALKTIIPDFSMIWYYNHRKNGIKVSLRSTDSSTDVSEVAQLFGGGGHRNAGGFFWNASSIEELLTSISSKNSTLTNIKYMLAKYYPLLIAISGGLFLGKINKLI